LRSRLALSCSVGSTRCNAAFADSWPIGNASSTSPADDNGAGAREPVFVFHDGCPWCAELAVVPTLAASADDARPLRDYRATQG